MLLKVSHNRIAIQINHSRVHLHDLDTRLHSWGFLGICFRVFLGCLIWLYFLGSAMGSLVSLVFVAFPYTPPNAEKVCGWCISFSSAFFALLLYTTQRRKTNFEVFFSEAQAGFFGIPDTFLVLRISPRRFDFPKHQFHFKHDSQIPSNRTPEPRTQSQWKS